MDFISCQVALGGDMGNTVPKTIPVSEVPVLQAIHGDSAVFDVELVDQPEDFDDLDNRAELQRLAGIYGHAQDAEGDALIMKVYPGRGARVVTSIEDLDLDDNAFKTVARANPKAAKAEKTEKAKPKRAKKAEVTEEIVEDRDGDGEPDVMG